MMVETELIDHETIGVGAPLLILNGGMMSFGAWEPLARPLSEDFKVVLCDFKGQLRSPGQPHASLEGHADDLVRLLDELGVPRAHVLGTSFGSEVGLVLAARHPQRVLTLVATAATDSFSEEMSREFTRLQEACRQAVTGGDRGLVHDFISCTVFSESYLKAQAAQLAERRKVMSFLPDYWFRGLDQLVECLKGLDLSPILPKVQCPVLVVAAGDDLVMPLARSEALCEKLPKAQLNVIPGCGHALVVERPDLMVRLTRQFCLLGS